MNGLEINTDKNRLDLHFIHGFISNSYWGKDRTIDAMQMCIDNSLNFGVYLSDKQIGYARVVTDYAQFAYIMDVFIDENHRDKGYSVALMKFIMECEALKNIKVWRLATADAHGLYKKFGFEALEKPENLMELIIKNRLK
ncbi:MAG: GNAT family N-acetyltransferase [Candidatus Fluviicola riflensis]|nr:MAG: GNAT family N-acetyltransferase [Candidatus Fluviicola riflensis]OGS79272.1 MAG: GNAT family N-acetyltransferase [Candidatus Fluviicola riflensis]OGS86704.1 MAG: GNAT family N-acetyltransferase [Fluviicola sp. RIFCSPHIGHO2_01_FULL_43_53]OGS88822.1 MAG: GNAT family N-acetyltransferase [Fluviicola sp. RIFCSPHIGHO2_12_FULL_43_24]